MPNDGARSGGNRPSRGDWRGAGRAAAPKPGRPAAAGAKGHDWARHKADDSTRLLWIFRAKIAFGVLLTASLFAAIVLMLPRPTTTPFVSFVITEYDYPLPPNAWAYDDVENIRRVLARDGENRTEGEPLAITDERQVAWKADREEWLHALATAVEKAGNIKWYQTLGRGPGKGAVIVYLSGLGVVDDDGRACLLLPALSEADHLFDPVRRLPIRDLFDRLFYDRDENEERLPRDVLKLVVLDAGRVDQNWELGLPYNAFADSLREVVSNELPVDNLFVLSSADAGQMAWPSPELGGTVFGHFVRRGLQGHADGYAADATVRDADRFITVDELYEYVRRQTTRFVATYRGDEQRPILLATAKTSDDARERRLVEYGASLLNVDKPDTDSVAAARRSRLAQIATKWEEIRREGWGHYERLAENGIRRHPLAWQRFEHLLLRLERLAVAGGAKAYQDQYSDGLNKLRELVKRLESAGPAIATPNSIALATALGTNPHAADAKALDAAAAALEAGKNAIEGPAAADYSFRAQAAWRWIAQSPANADLEKRLDRVQTEILPTKDKWLLEDEPVEIHFLRMLAAHRNPLSKLDPDVLASAIKCRAAAERAAAPADERTHYYSRPAAIAGDETRRQAEDLLFVGRPADVAKAKTASETAQMEFGQAEAIARSLADAFALRDRALAEIPWLVRYRARRLEAAAPTEQEDKALLELLDLHHDLKRHIVDFVGEHDTKGRFDATKVSSFANSTDSLRRRYEDLRKPILETMKKRSAQGSATDRLRLLDALAVPLLVGNDRQRLYDQARALFGDDFRYTELAPDSTAGAAVSDGRADHHVARMLKWNVHPALSLVDAPTSDIKPGERTSLAAVGTVMRKQLTDLESRITAVKNVAGDLALNAGLLPPTARTALADTDLASRAAGLYRGPLPRVSPAERLERFDRQRLLIWHFQRALDDFWGPSPTRVAKNDKTFFHVAAQRFASIARRQDDGLDARSPDVAMQTDVLNKALASRDQAAIDGLVPRFDDPDKQIRLDPGAKSKQPVDHRVTIERRADADLPVGTAAYYLAEAADADTSAATEDAALTAVSGRQVDMSDSRLNFEITAAARGGEQRLLPKYTIRDPLAQSQRTNYLRGLVLYRGHRFRHPSQLVELVPYGCEREFEYRPPNYPPPTVTIAGTQKPRAVLLVLDCSGSMVYDEQGKPLPRMRIAKQAVREAIAELRSANDKTKVGLWMYGHRTRYKNGRFPDINAPLEPSPFAAKFGGADTRPPADVEERVRLATLTDDVYTQIDTWVDRVNGHGSTPLYYAIHEAMTTGFSTLTKPQDYERQILVLTDGENWVYKKDDKIPEADRKRVLISEAMLAAALEQDREASAKAKIPPVRLDIIGYDFGDSEVYKTEDWDKGNRKELVDLLSRGTEPLGRLYDIRSEGETTTQQKLRELMQTLLGAYRFRIVDAASKAPVPAAVENGKPAPEILRLNTPITLTGRTGRYLVRFEGGVLEGSPPEDFAFSVRDRGEHLRLRLYDGRRSGILERWLQQEDTFADRVEYRARSLADDREVRGDDLKDTDNNPILIFPRPARWHAETAGVEFHVAIRYPDGKNNHTPQPVEALAVVQPRNNLDPVTIFDVTRVKGTNVPELSFVVPEWRSKAGDARQAIVWVWFKFDRQTAPLKKIRVDSPALDPIEVGPNRIRYGVRYGLDEERRVYWVKVTESHDDFGEDRPPTMDRIKVSMEDQPSRIHRCYITGGREVVHTFEYPERSGLDLDKLRQYNILLTRVEDMKKGAVHVHEAENKAMLVNIPTSR